MALPINISELIHGNTIESERLEFKKGWNPEEIIHTMCAFANDLNNWGGGYIIVGIAENQGRPMLPPEGLPHAQLDYIQGEIVQLCHRLSPHYFPITSPYFFEDRHIIVIWCPAGDNRPYSAPSTLGVGAIRQQYIRLGSRSIVAKDDNLRRLTELASRIPFDDRINNQASLDDLDLGLMRDYLQEIKSSLFDETTTMPFPDICRSMLIAKGPNENVRPVNVGLLFFCLHPERFFDRAWIELVWHQSYRGRNFKEVYFKGPIHKQLRDALSFIKSNIIMEHVAKSDVKPESDRFYNYPFEAVEEALSNAVYHKSYELGAPIEIQIFPDKMTILSYPGPVPPVNANILATQTRIIAREYRNRRIGDFLKELHLTEARGTGFPTIYDTLASNGSPKPGFETDDKTYVLTTLYARLAPPENLVDSQESNPVSNPVSNPASNPAKTLVFNTLADIQAFVDHNSNLASNPASNPASNQVSNQVSSLIKAELGDYAIPIMLFLQIEPKSKTEIMKFIDLSDQSKNKRRTIDPLLDYGWIAFTIPDKPTDQNQKYKLTNAGLQIVQLISAK